MHFQTSKVKDAKGVLGLQVIHVDPSTREPTIGPSGLMVCVSASASLKASGSACGVPGPLDTAKSSHQLSNTLQHICKILLDTSRYF